MELSHYGSGDIISGDKKTYYISASSFLPYSEELPFGRPEPYLVRQIFKQNEGSFQSYDRQSCNLIQEIEDQKRIVLLGDAGMGKSTELKHLCYQLKDAGYLPIHRRLDNYQSPNEAFSVLSEQADKIVLVLDGLDETKIDHAKRIIERFSDDYPDSRIVVSCRNSAYANTLNGFKEYQLGPLAFSEIKTYLLDQLGSFTETFLNYWSKRNQFSPLQLIDNPFFLIKICDYVLAKENRLPESLGDVFEYFISNALELRLKDISRYGEGDFEKRRKSCSRSLEKLAFVMECRGANFISEADLKIVIPEDNERVELLGKSSLIEIQSDNSWRFVHNNFQEYLSAKVLSKAKKFSTIKEALGAKPDLKRLKLSWINTLSFLFGILKERELKGKLFEWLAAEDIESLVKIASFESGRFNSSERENIFQKAFLLSKKEDTIIGFRHYNEEDIAKLIKDENSIQFLLSELNYKSSTVSNSIFLILLGLEQDHIYLSSGTENALKQKLTTILFDYIIGSPSNRYHATLVLVKYFKNIPLDEIQKIIEAYFDSEYSFDRTAAYVLIERFALQNSYMTRLIRRAIELDDPAWRKDKILGDETYYFHKCFESLQSEEDILTFFTCYPEIIEDWSDHKDDLPVNTLLDKALSFSKNSAEEIFESMKLRFADWWCFQDIVSSELVHSFISKFDFTFLFFQFCIDNNLCLPSILGFIDNRGIEYLVQGFESGKIDRSLITRIIFELNIHEVDKANLLLKKLNETAKPAFSLPSAPPSIKPFGRKEALLLEKQILFDKTLLLNKIGDFFSIIKKDSIDKSEVNKYRRVVKKEDKAYSHLLLSLIDDFSPISKDDLLERINDYWPWVSIVYIKQFLHNHVSELKHLEIQLAPDELAWIKEWCDNHLGTIKDDKFTKKDIVFSWLVFHCKFRYDEVIFFKLVKSGVQNELEFNIINYILDEKITSVKALINFVIESIQSKQVGLWCKSLYLDFIEQYAIQEAIPTLRRLVDEASEKPSTSSKALTILIKLEGDNFYLFNLLKKSDYCATDLRERILIEHLMSMTHTKGECEKILLQKLGASSTIDPKLFYSIYLTRLGNLKGLAYLVEYIEQKKESPFRDFDFRSSFNFENPKGVKLIINLLELSQHTLIVNSDPFNNVFNTSSQMLSHLASCQNGKHFHSTTKAIRRYIQKHKFLNKLPESIAKLLKVGNPETIKTLQYKLKDMEAHHFQKQEVSLEEAISLWQGIR